MEMRLRAPVTRGYFFLLGALHLVNAASPRNIDQKKYPLELRVHMGWNWYMNTAVRDLKVAFFKANST